MSASDAPATGPPSESDGGNKRSPDLSRLLDRLEGPIGFVAVATAVLLLVALLAVARAGEAFLLPIVLAVVLNFLFAPVVRFLSRGGLPTPAAAALVLVTLLGATGYGGYRLAGPTAEWIQKAPQTLRRAEYRLRGLKRSVAEVQQAAEQAEELASTGDGSRSGREVTVRERTVTETLTSGARSAAVGTVLMLFLLYFLLASGDLFLRKLARVLPRFGQRRNAVVIARRIEREISRYLFTMGSINVVLGGTVGSALWLLDMPNPLLWGVMAAVLNFVPYVGPAVGVAITGVVALVEFETTGRALLAPAVYAVVNALEGYMVTPLVLGRRLALNPVAILVGIIFWGWLWGIPGALLAVPLVAMVKIVSDHISALRPVGEFLGA